MIDQAEKRPDPRSLGKISALIGLLTVALSGTSLHAQDANDAFKQIQWTSGPAHVDLGTQAGLDLPAGYCFTDSAGAKLFREASQNSPSDNDLGIVVPSSFLTDVANGTQWWFDFSYEAVGYVKDDDQSSLTDATIDQILQSIRQGQDEANKLLLQRNWPTLTISGWEERPFYDATSHDLSWAIRLHSTSGDSINFETRILGRSGYISGTLICSPTNLAQSKDASRVLVTGVQFKDGARYAQFQAGEKVAEYGLIGLVTGGAAVAAVKFWPGFLKIGALILAALTAIGAKIKAVFSRKSTQPAMATAAVLDPKPSTDPTGDPKIKCPVCGSINRALVDSHGRIARCGRCKAVLQTAV